MPFFVSDRLAFIQDLVRGKDVLDLGSVGCSFNPKILPFEVIQNSAKSFMGIDLKPSSNSKIKRDDVETMNLKKKFDVIIAGDIIEHLYNPGSFLQNMKRHLKSDGILFISTPNIRSRCVLPFYKTNPEHTLWHDRYTIRTLLNASGFEIVDFYFYPGNKRLFLPLEIARLTICSLLPFLSEGMIVLVRIKPSEKGTLQ